MRSKSVVNSLVLCGLSVVILGVGLATGGSRSLVDWRALRAVAFESDDWGLPGFVPRPGAWSGLNRESLGTGRFPEVYWGSTLENAAVVDALAQIMSSHIGRDGFPAVWQPNYIMASMGWNSDLERWDEFSLPAGPPAYERPGLWSAVSRARQIGVWHPELHGYMHYDPGQRRLSAFKTPVAGEVTRRGIMLFPGSEAAREFVPGRLATEMQAEFDSSLTVFRRVFGRSPDSMIAPDYSWNGWAEDLWASRGLKIVQAKREQRDPAYSGRWGRLQKYFARQWSRCRFRGRVYLERNCRLEPVQASTAEMVVAGCVDETKRAWAGGQPAIVESHRVNYSHVDSAVVTQGMNSLDAYLQRVCGLPQKPLFLCDREIAQLQRRGVSWRRVGGQILVRNGTHSARLVAIPGGFASAGQSGQRHTVLVSVPAGTEAGFSMSAQPR